MPTGIYRRTKEHKEKISKALKDKLPKNFINFQRQGHEANRRKQGETKPNWKGDNVGYGGLHSWLRRKLGIPRKCERCGTTKAKRYEWSNISRKYKRDLSDWIRLCASCHRKEGYKRGEYVTWNKGKKTGIVPKTAIKKGQHLSRATEFKKGMIPRNKYLETKICITCSNLFQPREAKRKYCSQKCYWTSMQKVKET